MYVILTNYVNWHGKFAVGQGKHRESTGNLKIQFEWVPCTWCGLESHLLAWQLKDCRQDGKVLFRLKKTTFFSCRKDFASPHIDSLPLRQENSCGRQVVGHREKGQSEPT